MEKNKYIKATILAIIIGITVVLFRHINFLPEYWNIFILILVMFFECFAIDKLVDKFNKKQ